MSLPIFYAHHYDVDLDDGTVALRGGDARHMVRSLRAREGDVVQVSDAQGAVYAVRIGSMGYDVVAGEIIDSSLRAREEPRILLFQAIAKPSKMDEAVQRAAEAGVSELLPFTSRRSPEGASVKAALRLERWRKLALEASKVARHPFPLGVGEPRQWPIGAPLGEGLNVLLWKDESARGLRAALPESPPASIGLVVGPEGGFDEVDAREIEGAGAVPASIGSFRLRTESAGAYAAMLIRYHYGLLEPGSER